MRSHVLKVTILAVVFSSAAFSTTIFFGDFTDPGNVGTIGGGILTPPASDIPIGAGPWAGTYHGIVGVLAPPHLAISTTGGFTGGSATVSDIAGVNVLGSGTVDNYGWFFRDIGLAYVSHTRYTLIVNIFTDGLVNDLSLFSNDGVGIGLTDASDNLIASSTDPSAILSIKLLQDTFYQMTLQFDTGNTPPPSNIGVRLFDQPTGLATANLFASVSFSDVALNATPNPEPATFLLTGVALLIVGWGRTLFHSKFTK